MPRPPRYPLAGVPQLVSQKGNNNQQVFFCERDFRFYLTCLSDAAQTHECDVHAYALMPSHIQLLCTPNQCGGGGKMMQSIGRTYVP